MELPERPPCQWGASLRLIQSRRPRTIRIALSTIAIVASLALPSSTPFATGTSIQPTPTPIACQFHRKQFKRHAARAFSGKNTTAKQKAYLGIISKCANHSDQKWIRQLLRGLKNQQHIAHLPMATAQASWFNDRTGDGGGPPACGFYADKRGELGFASRTLPCGSKVYFCARRCATGVVQDRGPAASTGRDFDFTPGLKSALGFGDTGSVRYRIIR